MKKTPIHPMAEKRTLRSDGSGGSESWDALLMCIEGFEDSWVADGDRTVGMNTAEEGPGTNRSGPDKDKDFGRIDGKGPDEEGIAFDRCHVAELLRQDVPGEVQIVEEQNPDGGNLQWHSKLVAIPEQPEEGHKEVGIDQSTADNIPSVGDAILSDFPNDVPESHLGNVGVVDEEELGETDVGPEDGEGQHEAAQQIGMRRLEDTVQAVVFLAGSLPEKDQYQRR